MGKYQQSIISQWEHININAQRRDIRVDYLLDYSKYLVIHGSAGFTLVHMSLNLSILVITDSLVILGVFK